MAGPAMAAMFAVQAAQQLTSAGFQIGGMVQGLANSVESAKKDLKNTQDSHDASMKQKDATHKSAQMAQAQTQSDQTSSSAMRKAAESAKEMEKSIL